MNKIIGLAGIILMGAFAFAGCTKVADNVDPAIFGGTWNGTLTCTGMDPIAGSITIAMSGSTATIAGETGVGACTKAATYTGKVYNDHLLFSTQRNDDACGNSNSFSASIYVYQNRMTATQSLSGPAITTDCSFVGSK